MAPDPDRLAKNPVRPFVFISYGHRPDDKASFASSLAGELKRVGIDYWLDEEKIYAGLRPRKPIEDAIRSSTHVIVILDEQWGRDWTEGELMLVAKTSAKRIGIVRIPGMTLEQLPVELMNRTNVWWPPDDGEPEARMWEVYCGVTERPPGARKDWVASWRNLAGGSVAPPSRPSIEPLAETNLPWRGTPEWALCGESLAYLGSDAGEWICVGAGTPQPLPPVRGRVAAAVVGHGDGLAIGTYESGMWWGQDGPWRYQQVASPVLALATARGPVAVGHASGHVSRMEDGTVRSVGLIREPVFDLALTTGRLVVLGTGGLLGSFPWPEVVQEDWCRFDLDRLGRPCGLFPSTDAGIVGIYTSDQVALADAHASRVTRPSREIPGGIRSVLRFAPDRLAVMTDEGPLLILDGLLQRVQRVAFPAGAAARTVGCCPDGAGKLLAWTQQGALYAVDGTGGVAELFTEGVALVCPGPLDRGPLVVVRTESGGHRLKESRA
jgi:hypothetical protein